MLKKVLMVAVMSAVTASAYAVDRSLVKDSIPLKDGTTVYIFKDGKMGMENQYGKPVSMKPGHVMETVDGRKVIMVGNELMRVETLRGIPGAQ